MQRRLLAARRYAMSQHAMDGAAGVDLGALGQQSKGGSALAYPALVYASYNPACPPEGRGGKPGNTSTPRRLLSNRWNSAVQYRTCDLRIADTGTIGRSDVLADCFAHRTTGAGTDGNPRQKAHTPGREGFHSRKTAREHAARPEPFLL